MNASAVEPKKFFTVAEANQRLPLVRAIVDDIVRLFVDVQERRQRLADLIERNPRRSQQQPSVYSEEIEHMEADLQADMERWQGFVGELAELGVDLKDPAVGLVDFPTLVEGQEACLCWKFGEPDVGFWHYLNAGFRGRKPVADLLPCSPFEESKE